MRFNVLHEAFEAQADLHPHATAVVTHESKFTYLELECFSNKLARLLRSRGVGRGSTVAILLGRSYEAYASILGTLKSGAAYVPLEPEYPPERIAFILRDSGASALLTTESLSSRALDFEGEIIRLDVDARTIESQSADRLASDDVGLAPDDLCYIIYTSGTTGRPKGVQVEHRNAAHLISAEAEIYRVRPEDRVCQAASLSFDLSVEEVWLAFNSGAVLCTAPLEASHGGPDFADFINHQRVTVLSTVPTLLSTIEEDLPTVRLLILGGESCPDRLVKKWATSSRRLVNTYGPTETTVIATYAELRPGRKVNIGVPVRGYSVRILDENLRELPPGTTGEICIGGAGVARGYVRLSEETSSRFISDPHSGASTARLYRTGDLGRLNHDGTIDFLGRADSQVKLRGFRVELSEIESALMKLDGVRSAACKVQDSGPQQQVLVGYVVTNDGREFDERAMRSALRDVLPSFMVPTFIERVESLPTLPSGKLDREALPPPRPRRRSASTESGTRTGTERHLIKVWSGLFRPMEVSANDDFFLDLGGHSLLAARMVSELRRDPRFSDISIADVYENPTVRSLARLADSRRTLLITPAAPRRPAGSGHKARPPASPLRSTAVQAIGLYFGFGLRALEWVTPYLVFFALLITGHPLVYAALWALAAALLVFPTLFVVALVSKWIVLGRIRAGRHPLWGSYYLRWWFVQSLVSVLPLDYLAGTPLLPAAFRLFGARVGKNVLLETQRIRAFDLVSIGDGTSVDEDAALLGYSVEGGELIIGPISIGRGCFVGTRSVVEQWTKMEDGARLDDLSLLPRGQAIPGGETWAGSPAAPAPERNVDLPAPPTLGATRNFATTILYGLLALSLPVLVLIALFPGVIVLFSIDPLTQPALYLAAVPVLGAFFVLTVMSEYVLLKWALLGRVKPGVYPVHSSFYIRNWVVDQMHALSLDLVAPLHATMYLAPWYRALGARIGKSVELSTATSTTPDLLELGDGSTVADESSLGSPHTEKGWMTVAPTVIGRRAFVGNSAVIPAGTVMGERTLCGVLSLPPSDAAAAAEPGATWLGSPPIALPRRQTSEAFTERRTFSPTRRMRLIRGAVESLRVTLPPAGFILVTTSTLSITTLLWGLFGFVPALLLLPVTYGVVCGALCISAAAAKWVIIGRYRPFEKPLWTTFIWKLELVNALYEFLVTPLALEPLQGTPFLPAYQRLLGSKVGKGVYIHTTGFLEWDLVEIGDGAALNDDCVLQTHLFEDRVLKASYLRVGVGSAVGAYSVVLYESEMEDGSSLDPLSLVMKGERLPARTSWSGIPARRKPDEIEVVEEIG